MKTRWGGQVEDLQSWFDIACGPLCSDTQEMIGYEVSSHYDEAYDAAVESGMGPEDANEAALVSLGDPYKARDGFRQVHVTKAEMRRLYPSRLWTVTSAALVMLCWALFALEPDMKMTLALVPMTFLLGRSLFQGQQAIALIVAYGALSVATIAYVGAGDGRFMASVLTLLWVFVVVAACEQDIRLQKKLRRIERKG